jgi:integrase
MHQHRLLSEVLQMAVEWQVLVRNPCDAVRAPKLEKREVAVIDQSEAAWLITAAEGTRLHLPILLTTCAGLRRGEILAATWTNIDKQRRILSISRAVSEPKKNVILFKKPKSKRTRKVALTKLLMEALELHRKEQEENREALGAAYQDDDLICCQPDGSVWKPSAFTSAYRALLKRRKLTGPNFHALRHSHASHMLADGVDIKTVSARLGHSKASFTLDQYIHLLPGQDEEAANRTDATMGKALEETRPSKVM